MYSHSPRLTLDSTPPMVPASSPDDFMYFAPFTIGICPSHVTVVGPCDVSDDWPMLGYGIGIGGAGGAGVLHTSGKTGLMPPLPLCAMPREFAKVVWPMTFLFVRPSS